MKKTVSIYLVNDNLGWQTSAMTSFNKLSSYFGYSIYVANPSIFSFKKDDAKKEKRYCFSKLMQSDIVLCCLNGSMLNPMIAQQIQYAADAHMPIIAYGSTDIDPWIMDDCDAVFKSLEEAVEYIREYYLDTCGAV